MLVKTSYQEKVTGNQEISNSSGQRLLFHLELYTYSKKMVKEEKMNLITLLSDRGRESFILDL
jgi:hypothetical protein